jgi:hypothetical protein
MDNQFAILKEKAKTSEEGNVLFYKVSANLIVSLYITTGKPVTSHPNKREVHLRFMQEPCSFPKFDLKEKSLNQVGYEEYKCVRTRAHPNSSPMEYDVYTMMFDETCEIMNKLLHKYHGVVCYEDGDRTNDTVTNVIVLQICDILNIISSRKQDKQPELHLPSNLLESINTRLSNELETCFATKCHLNLLVEHIDFFYTCYT